MHSECDSCLTKNIDTVIRLILGVDSEGMGGEECNRKRKRENVRVESGERKQGTDRGKRGISKIGKK